MNLFEGITFANPGLLWLLLLLPLLPAWSIWRKKRLQGNLVLPTLGGFQQLKPAYPVLRCAGLVLRLLALALLIVALARPQSALSWQDSTTEGIDIVIATDISGSMLSEDLKPNRLEAGKKHCDGVYQGPPL